MPQANTWTISTLESMTRRAYQERDIGKLKQVLVYIRRYAGNPTADKVRGEQLQRLVHKRMRQCLPQESTDLEMKGTIESIHSGLQKDLPGSLKSVEALAIADGLLLTEEIAAGLPFS